MKYCYSSTKENVRHKINTSLRMFINRLHADFPPHWHTDIEIIWPKEAPYKIICANQTYHVEVDDILLICPTIIHEIFSPTPGTRVYIQADFSGIINLKEMDRAFRLMSPALHIKKKTCPPDIYNYLCGLIDTIMKLYLFQNSHLTMNLRFIQFLCNLLLSAEKTLIFSVSPSLPQLRLILKTMPL